MIAAHPMQINIITAFDLNQLIGNAGQLPWSLPEDLQYFKTITLHHPIVMGRKTYESIGRPLPKRHNIVISKTLNPQPGITVIQCPSQLAGLKLDAPAFIIGGQAIYDSFLPQATLLYITHLDNTFEGNVYFPNIDWSQWKLMNQLTKHASDHIPFSRRYCVYQRVSTL